MAASLSRNLPRWGFKIENIRESSLAIYNHSLSRYSKPDKLARTRRIGCGATFSNSTIGWLCDASKLANASKSFQMPVSISTSFEELHQTHLEFSLPKWLQSLGFKACFPKVLLHLIREYPTWGEFSIFYWGVWMVFHEMS